MKEAESLSSIISPEQFRELANCIANGRSYAMMGQISMLDITWIADIRKFADQLENLKKESKGD